MYELNRARVVGIGPRAARYTDVTLDLSGLGEQVPPTNLFDPPGRRPAPSSLLLLENGGGKSVLLKLLFSVVLPGRRNTVGGGALDDFVLDGDNGHVALEWMHVRTGQRFVTAKAYERRSRSSDKNPIAEAWYSFRPSATIDLDSLPVAVEGRRRRLAGFKEAIEEINHLEPATELSWFADDQGGWRSHLRERGLEPDLFDIQRRMNVDEGEAAKAFKYASSKDFVDWLLTTVTDPADAASVAGTFSQWAANLAERDQMILERDFLEGAIAGLDPIGHAHEAHRHAARNAAAADQEAEELAAALGSRLRADREQVAKLTAEHEAAQSLASTRANERDAAREVTNEIGRQTLQLELAEVDCRRAQLQRHLDAAELELHGWQTLPAIVERDQAIAAADQLATQVAAADEDAAPALARRDEAAGRLLAKYWAEADVSDRLATELDERVAAAKNAAAAADEERTTALGAAATATERYRAAQAAVTEAAQRLVEAAAAGLVPAGTTPAQVAHLAEDAHRHHAEMLVELHAAKSAATAQATRCGELMTELNSADTACREATTASDAASGELAVVENQARRLAGLTILREVGGADAPVQGLGDAYSQPRADGNDLPAGDLSVDDLDEAADRLLVQLRSDAGAHTEVLDGLRALQHEDTRVIEALGEGGLLPPREDVERALHVLQAAGVAAHAGWRYLHDAVPPEERAALIAAHPALADGIIVVDAQQLRTAHHALAQARLLPAAAVAVGSGAALLRLDTGIGHRRMDNFADEVPDDQGEDAAGNGFVVEPTPALYDEDAAAERREELDEQMARRGAHMQQAEDQLQAIRDAHDELQRWRRVNPAGRLTKLREAASAALERLREAQDLLVTATQNLERAEDDCQQADHAVERAVIKERQASERALGLKGLAELVRSAAQEQLRLPEYEADVSKHKTAGAAALTRRGEAEREQSELTRLAEQARGQAQRHRAACDEVVSTSGHVAAMVPEESLANLKAAADAAQLVYLAAAVNPDLRRQADDTAAKVQTLSSQLTLRDPTHVAEAERLRATPAGADRASWSTNVGNARRTVETVRGEVGDLKALEGRLDEKLRGASPTEPGRRSWTTLSDHWRPINPDHGRTLHADAMEELRQAQTRLEEATSTSTRLERQRDSASEAARGFNEALLPLTGLLIPADRSAGNSGAGEAVVAPYAGDVETAQRVVRTAVTTLRETKIHLERCMAELTSAVQHLVRFANQGRYEALTNSARRSILESSPDLLAAKAAEWSVALQARLATLTSDLENANRHRKTIVDRLTALVDQSVKTLRQATKLSRLPDDLAEWGGRPFLQIKFSEPDRSATSIRVGEVVDKVAAQLAGRAVGSKTRNARRDGMSLLLEAVHASVPKGFTVDVLKPDSVLRDERVSIEEMNDVFSGGQELTAAIVLYCTLAALSANKRGQMRSRHSGVLFLDNPIGRANASYLIDLQQSVARALGVQLIYTTGISDDRVLAAFPLWVRLRNDADLRAGLKHIQVADVVRRQLPAPYAEDESTAGALPGAGRSAAGTVTATRVHRRPAQQAAADHAAGAPGPAPRDTYPLQES